ncbi:MAG: hypothetical protein AAFV53_40860 [Myxococcota bacterium]
MIRPATLLFALLTGCGPDDPVSTAVDYGPRGDCDPLTPSLCGLPFPSTFFMAPDDTTPTGMRVDLGSQTMPAAEPFRQPAPTYWNERDGWAVAGPIMTHFPGISLNNLPGHGELESSIAQESPTILLDAQTGERLGHFVELDMSHEDDARRMLFMFPAAPLAYGRRYIVAFRDLIDDSGASLEASDAFAALRDARTTDDPDIERRRERFETSIFPVLEDAGIKRDGLTLAWDFVTGSREGITGRAVWMRDDMLKRIGSGGPAYVISSVEDGDNAQVLRKIRGSVTVPMYTETDVAGTVLTRGDDGMPYYNGETVLPFTIIIPQSAADRGPLPVMQYGHGLLGNQNEVNAGHLEALAHTYGYILFAMDWTGMKAYDIFAIVNMIAEDIDEFAMIPERSQQGFVEMAAGLRMLQGDLADDPVMQVTDPDSGETFSAVDTETAYYYGISQGGILGGAYVALSTDIERAVFGVGGLPYALLLFRSTGFEAYFEILRGVYPDPLELSMMIGYMQTLWDSAESSGYARSMTSDPLPGTPTKSVLMQVAIGDAQVTTLGAQMQARAYGAALIDPPTRPVWDIPIVEGPHVGSALIEWDYGIEEPYENLPPAKETDTHARPRREPAAQRQLDRFLRTGEVVNFCEGVCQDLGD